MYIVTDNWKILGTYKSEKSAKSAKTRKWVKKFPNARVMDSETFHREEPMVERINLMSGRTFKLRLSEAGGCCDPSTERYWSM